MQSASVSDGFGNDDSTSEGCASDEFVSFLLECDEPQASSKISGASIQLFVVDVSNQVQARWNPLLAIKFTHPTADST